MLKVLDPSREAGITYEQFLTMSQASAQPQPISSPNQSSSSSSSGGHLSGGGGLRSDNSSMDGGEGSAVFSEQVVVAALDEGPDPKVEEFLRILEEYRGKCEVEGNYEEAARATEQLDTLRKQEEARRIKALKSRHISERAEVAQAHVQQYSDFNTAWDRYLAEYDAMASMYVKQMQERHATKLRDFQENLHTELMKKPLKFGRELLDWRSREQMLAKQKKYSEAARIKGVADEHERRERARLDEERLSSFGQREAKFRIQQNAEQSALLKRVETRRAEHVKQRELDSKRLLQRNRNVMAVLEQRQSQEEQKRIGEIRLSLAPPRTQARLHQLQSGSLQRRAAQTAAAVQLGGGPDFGVLNVGGVIGTGGADASTTLKSPKGNSSSGGGATSNGANASRIGGGGGGASGSSSFKSPGLAKQLIKQAR